MIASYPPKVEPYVSSVVRACASPESGIVSVVLFGSAAMGSYSPEISDVDLLIVLDDIATAQDRCRARDTISYLEARSGIKKQYPHRRGALDATANRVTANVRSFSFVQAPICSLEILPASSVSPLSRRSSWIGSHFPASSDRA
jgi:predicted nucleotidyltransferase